MMSSNDTIILAIVINEKSSLLSYLTSKSTSLFSVSSPREHEPKSHAFSMGWLARYCCIFGIISCTFLLIISDISWFLLQIYTFLLIVASFLSKNLAKALYQPLPYRQYLDSLAVYFHSFLGIIAQNQETLAIQNLGEFYQCGAFSLPDLISLMRIVAYLFIIYVLIIVALYHFQYLIQHSHIIEGEIDEMEGMTSG